VLLYNLVFWDLGDIFPLDMIWTGLVNTVTFGSACCSGTQSSVAKDLWELKTQKAGQVYLRHCHLSPVIPTFFPINISSSFSSQTLRCGLALESFAI
jgi:hypothetical protein